MIGGDNARRREWEAGGGSACSIGAALGRCLLAATLVPKHARRAPLRLRPAPAPHLDVALAVAAVAVGKAQRGGGQRQAAVLQRQPLVCGAHGAGGAGEAGPRVGGGGAGKAQHRNARKQPVPAKVCQEPGTARARSAPPPHAPHSRFSSTSPITAKASAMSATRSNPLFCGACEGRVVRRLALHHLTGCPPTKSTVGRHNGGPQTAHLASSTGWIPGAPLGCSEGARAAGAARACLQNVGCVPQHAAHLLGPRHVVDGHKDLQAAKASASHIGRVALWLGGSIGPPGP